MKCNPLRWLWGIVPLTLIWWIGLLGERARIETDLQNRVQGALTQAGLTWAGASFNGREALVSGRAGEESEQRQAASVVEKVWGVRSTEDRTDVLELIKNYIWSASVRGSDIVMTGYVPNEAARKAVMGTARATFSGRKIDDQLKLARGAPEQSQWLGGVTFGLKQLSQLKSGGRVALEGSALNIQGEADTAGAYKSIKTALSSGLPKGVSLKADGVTAPAVKPYTWAASTRGRQAELTGHVPSEATRDRVFAAAKQAMPGATIVDRMIIASGEPADYQKTVSTTLAALGQLTQGDARLQDTQVTISGLTEKEETAEAVRRSIKSGIASNYRVNEQIQQDPKIKAQEEAARVAAEAARKAAAEAETRRRADAQSAEQAARQQQSAQQQQLAAADDAARQRAAADAARRAAEDAQTRARAAEDAQAKARAAEAAVAKARVDVQRCQTELRSAAGAGSINFKRASADIERQSFSTLDRLAAIAKNCPDAVIEIGGHTDNEGEPGRNQRLSERRAKSVAEYLTKAGVPDRYLAAVGYGEVQPVAPNDTAENMARNRRIEFNVKAK